MDGVLFGLVFCNVILMVKIPQPHYCIISELVILELGRNRQKIRQVIYYGRYFVHD